MGAFCFLFPMQKENGFATARWKVTDGNTEQTHAKKLVLSGGALGSRRECRAATVLRGLGGGSSERDEQLLREAQGGKKTQARGGKGEETERLRQGRNATRRVLQTSS